MAEGQYDQPVHELTAQAIEGVNKRFGEAGLSDISDFMGNIAATESKFGRDKLGSYSFSPFQIDSVRHQDIIDRAPSDRMEIANSYLQEALGDSTFSLADVPYSDLVGEKYGHNPYIGATLTRMGLANIKEAVPGSLEGQADYWKKYWNTFAENAKGKPEHFIERSERWNPGATMRQGVTNPYADEVFDERPQW